MKKTSLLIALLGASVASGSLIKQNIEGNMQRSNLAEQSHDLSAVVFPNGGECDITYTPPVNTNPNPPPVVPNSPPPQIISNPCPSMPGTTLGGTGILTAVGTQTAAERTVEHTCFKDTACSESITAEENQSGSNNEYESSCLCRKKLYCLNGCIDYERHQT